MRSALTIRYSCHGNYIASPLHDSCIWADLYKTQFTPPLILIDRLVLNLCTMTRECFSTDSENHFVPHSLSFTLRNTILFHTVYTIWMQSMWKSFIQKKINQLTCDKSHLHDKANSHDKSANYNNSLVPTVSCPSLSTYYPWMNAPVIDPVSSESIVSPSHTSPHLSRPLTLSDLSMFTVTYATDHPITTQPYVRSSCP